MTYNWRPKAEPHLPADYDDEVVLATRAVSAGTANPNQQKLFWTWLMYVTAASEEFQDLSYRPGEQGIRATDFAEGKRHVGQTVRKMLRPELTPKPKAPPAPHTVADVRARRRNRQQEKDS